MNQFDVQTVIDLCEACLQFGRVNRVTHHEDGETLESDTDHTVMLGIAGCAFAAKYAPHLDLGLVAQFALIHDFVEIYCGDTSTIGASQATLKSKAEREAQALVTLRSNFGALPWLADAIEMYDRLSTPEARFVKLFDKILPKVTHLLNRGSALREQSISFEEVDRINAVQLKSIQSTYGNDQPEAIELYLAIHRELIAALGHKSSI